MNPETNLRKQLSQIALGIRRPRIENHPTTQPIFNENYDIVIAGKLFKRKKIVLASPGCSAATCTMCPIPNESYLRGNMLVTPDDYMEQFRSAFEGESLDEFQMMSVYNSGNWFVDKEVPPKARQGIYSTIASSKCEALIVESLPQFITQKSIKEAKTFLGNKQLIVAIGLQSANDFVRNVCVNTTCTKQQFERAVTLLWKNDYIPRAYLMIKPPFLTELEAIEDAVSSIHYVASLGFEDVSICPTRIAPHTIAAELMKRGLYEPPSLWSVIEILRRVQEKGISTRVSCLDLDGKDDDTFYPRSCKQCTPQLIEALKKFNRTADLTPVEQIKCDCKYEYQSRVANEVDDTPLPDRIRNFINLFNAQASDTIPIERTT